MTQYPGYGICQELRPLQGVGPARAYRHHQPRPDQRLFHLGIRVSGITCGSRSARAACTILSRLPEETVAVLENARMDPAHDHLNALLDD